MAKKTEKTARKSTAKRPKKTSRQKSSIDKQVVRAGGSVVSGNVSIKGGTFVGRDKIDVRSSSTEVQVLFQPIYRAIADRPNTSSTDRADLEAEVKELEAEVVKGQKADENFLLRRMRNIKRMAPDILEVVMATIANPAAGLGLAATKVAKKMSEEAGAG